MGSDAAPERGITVQVWPTTASIPLKQQINNNKSNELLNDFIAGLVLELSKPWRSNNCPPRKVKKWRFLQDPR